MKPNATPKSMNLVVNQLMNRFSNRSHFLARRVCLQGILFFFWVGTTRLNIHKKNGEIFDEIGIEERTRKPGLFVCLFVGRRLFPISRWVATPQRSKGGGKRPPRGSRPISWGTSPARERKEKQNKNQTRSSG